MQLLWLHMAINKYMPIFSRTICMQSSLPAGLTQEQWNLVRAYHWYIWSLDSIEQEDKVKLLTQAVVFQEHCEVEDSSEENPSKEDPSDAAQLYQLTGEPQTPPQSQVIGTP